MKKLWWLFITFVEKALLMLVMVVWMFEVGMFGWRELRVEIHCWKRWVLLFMVVEIC